MWAVGVPLEQSSETLANSEAASQQPNEGCPDLKAPLNVSFISREIF